MSTEAATQTKNQHSSPLKLFQRVFCNGCPYNEYCNTNTQRRLQCILTLIADEIARTRQLIQHRTQHLNWWETQ